MTNIQHHKNVKKEFNIGINMSLTMHSTVFRMLEMSRLLQHGRDFLLNHLLNHFFYSLSRSMPRDLAAAFGWRSVPSARREGEVSLSLHCSQSAAAATAAA